MATEAMITRLAERRVRTALAGIALLGGLVLAELLQRDGNSVAMSAFFAFCLAVLLGTGKVASP